MGISIYDEKPKGILKNKLENEDIKRKYDIHFRNGKPYLGSGDFKVIGLNLDEEKIVVISDLENGIGDVNIKEIIWEYNLINILDNNNYEKSIWKENLELIWEESTDPINHYWDLERYLILVLKLKKGKELLGE